MPSDRSGGQGRASVEERGVELGRLVAALARSVAGAAAESASSPIAVRSVKLHLTLAFCGGKTRPEVIIDSDRLSQLPPHAASTLDVELCAGPE